jgi:cytochrome c peroxidase
MAELATLDGTAPPADVASTLFDGVFTRNQRDMIAEMTNLGAPPADPTNAYADDPRAAQLGVRLFNDRSLSPSGTVACISCHDPQRAWADSRPVSLGVDLGGRNAPSTALAAYSRWQFWDGRADSLWAQALGPFENPKEFGSSRLFVVNRVAAAYRADYEAIFGAMPDVSVAIDDSRRARACSLSR